MFVVIIVSMVVGVITRTPKENLGKKIEEKKRQEKEKKKLKRETNHSLSSQGSTLLASQLFLGT